MLARRMGMLVRLAQVLLVAFAAAGAAAAQEDKAFEGRVEALRGYWLAAPKDATGARVLRITNVLLAEPKFAVLAGYFGTASSPIWSEAKDITARLEGQRIALEIVSADGAKIALVTGAQGELLGAADRPGGGAPALRFSRVSLPELHRFAAENPLPRVRARRGSKIELVYIGADAVWQMSQVRRQDLRVREGFHLREITGREEAVQVQDREGDSPTAHRPEAGGQAARRR